MTNCNYIVMTLDSMIGTITRNGTRNRTNPKHFPMKKREPKGITKIEDWAMNSGIFGGMCNPHERRPYVSCPPNGRLRGPEAELKITFERGTLVADYIQKRKFGVFGPIKDEFIEIYATFPIENNINIFELGKGIMDIWPESGLICFYNNGKNGKPGTGTISIEEIEEEIEIKLKRQKQTRKVYRIRSNNSNGLHNMLN